MAKRAKKSAKSSASGATVGYEAELWQMADALRGSMDAAEYKHVVLGRVYGNVLAQFASAEGKKGGEFYTPCCGSPGMFVQPVEFLRAHAGGNDNGAKA